MADGGEQKASLAFSFQKKKVVQKVAANVQERKDAGQLISGFDGAQAQVVGGDVGEAKLLVIPKIENTFKTGVGPKKFTPTFKPPSGEVVRLKEGEDKFIQAESTVPVITGYGLQLRDVNPEERAAAGVANGSGGAKGNITAAVLEERAYREAVEELPDMADVEAYEAMPIEEFGRAMLRGMGWEEGMGVGRNRQKVEAIEYVRRPERLGLGAQPVKLAEDPNKTVKMGDKPRKQDLVLAPDADGRQRNVRTLDEQLVARSAVQPGPQPGKPMRILSGPHSGLQCTALEAMPKPEGRPERWRVRLALSNEEVEVLGTELGEKWQKEPTDSAAGGSGRDTNGNGKGSGRDSRGGGAGTREAGRGGSGSGLGGSAEGDDGPSGSGRRGGGREEGGGSRHGGSYDDEGGRDRERDRDREREREGGSKRKHRDQEDEEEGRHGRKHHKHEKREKHEKKEKKEKKHKHKEHKRAARDDSDDSDGGGSDERPSGPTWLHAHIKVRIVDKHVRGGKLYLKKGTVVDVHPGATADVSVDDTADVLRLPQSALETVVPKHEGAVVLIVGGPHRGSRGRLLQANTSAGAAAVQLAIDFSIVRLRLDNVAGYAGEMEEE